MLAAQRVSVGNRRGRPGLAPVFLLAAVIMLRFSRATVSQAPQLPGTLLRTQASLRIHEHEALMMHRHIIFIVQNDKRFNRVRNRLQRGINLQSTLCARDAGFTDDASGQQTSLLQRCGVFAQRPMLPPGARNDYACPGFYQDFVKREFGEKGPVPRGLHWFWWAVATLIAVGLIIMWVRW